MLGLVGALCLAFGGEKDTHQVIYQTIYQKKVVAEPKIPASNQPAYIQQSYSREYYYKSCMMGHEKPITSVDEMAKDIANQLVCSELTPIRAPIGVSVIQTFMLINPKGEFYLSRNINNLRKEYKIGYVLVGTYSVGDYSTSVNARIIDASNGLVVATAHASIPTQIMSDLLYNSSQSVPELQLRGSSMVPSYQNVAQVTSVPAQTTPEVTSVPVQTTSEVKPLKA